jgi:hypothetical protein
MRDSSTCCAYTEEDVLKCNCNIIKYQIRGINRFLYMAGKVRLIVRRSRVMHRVSMSSTAVIVAKLIRDVKRYLRGDDDE